VRKIAWWRRLAPGVALAVLCAGLAGPGPLRAEDWLTRTDQGLVFRYTPADQVLADTLWPVLAADREAIMERLRLFPAEPLTVVLAPTWAVFRALLPAGADAEALGMYVPARRTIYLRAPRTDPAGEWDLRGVLRHELAHGLIDLAIDQPVPLWLHEGLAILLSNELSFLDEAQLSLRSATERLIPLASLVVRFPSGRHQQGLAYSEAASFVRFLLKQDGMHGLQELLAALSRGVSPLDAFSVAYGRSITVLEGEWRDELAARFSWVTLVTTTSVLGGLGVPLVLLGVLRRWVQRRQAYRRWEREELARSAPLPPGRTLPQAEGEQRARAPPPSGTRQCTLRRNPYRRYLPRHRPTE
jgi:hypothetical protein